MNGKTQSMEALQTAFEQAWGDYQTQLVGGVNGVLQGNRVTPEELVLAIRKQQNLWYQPMRATGLFRAMLRDRSPACEDAFRVFIENKLDFKPPFEVPGMRAQTKYAALGVAVAAGVASYFLAPVHLALRITFLVAPGLLTAGVISRREQNAQVQWKEGIRAWLSQSLDALRGEALDILALAAPSSESEVTF